MIELHVQKCSGLTRETFISTHPAYSIALDGYVAAEPFLEIHPTGPYRNFNHHEAVDRSCTAATCEQARRAVLLGLYMTCLARVRALQALATPPDGGGAAALDSLMDRVEVLPDLVDGQTRCVTCLHDLTPIRSCTCC